MLERVEALLLHPFLASGPKLADWTHVYKMLSAGRHPGTCSFGELCSDPETLLAISLREDPGRTPVISVQNIRSILNPQLSVLEAAQSAAQHSQEACREAAARVCAKHAAVVAFACCGRGCGRGREEARKAANDFRGSPAVDLTLRQVVASLLRCTFPSELESAARRATRGMEREGAELAALRFLSQNIGVPRDMAPAPAAALRTRLLLHLAALEGRGPGKGLARPPRQARLSRPEAEPQGLARSRSGRQRSSFGR